VSNQWRSSEEIGKLAENTPDALSIMDRKRRESSCGVGRASLSTVTGSELPPLPQLFFSTVFTEYETFLT
jgi:hypothetical protein